MDLQQIIAVVGLLSPFVMMGVAWGSYVARLRILEKRVELHEQAIDRAHTRIDVLQG